MAGAAVAGVVPDPAVEDGGVGSAASEFVHGAITHCDISSLSTYPSPCMVGVRLSIYDVSKLPAAQLT